MSRYCGKKHDTKAILSAAEQWESAALLRGGSVFSTEQLWVSENLDSLKRYFVEKQDVGEGVFLAKLKTQLSPAPVGAKKLAAEMMWLLYLCPSNLTIQHKRRVVDTVWSWSETPLPETQWLSDDVLGGIGSAGPGFNQNQWRELAFLTNFMLEFRTLTEDAAARVVAAP